MSAAYAVGEANPVVLPVEVHIFERGGVCYAFDPRSYCIIELTPLGRAVLERLSATPLAAIETALSDRFGRAEIRAQYLQFIELIRDGTLAVEPPELPRAAPFSSLVLMLAGGCNMGCAYCFEKDVPIYQKPNLLSREKAAEILDWFFANQEGPMAHFELYGGEPTLNWDVLEYVVERIERWAGENAKHVSKYMITNGTLLSPERVAFLKKHDVTVQVSVDGNQPTHDRFRVTKSGAPTSERISRAIDELKRQNADFNLRAVVTRANIDVGEILAALRARGAPVVSFGVASTADPRMKFTDAEWTALVALYSGYIETTRESGDLPDSIKTLVRNLIKRRRVVYGCGAGMSEVTVAPDGNIYECQRLAWRPIANIAEKKSAAELGSTFLVHVDDRDGCRECFARYLCGGGCKESFIKAHGSEAPLPGFCRMKRMEVEEAIVTLARTKESAQLARLAGERGVPIPSKC